jgi:hypothetical protein
VTTDLILCGSFFRPAGRKNDPQKKKSTMLPQAKTASRVSPPIFTWHTKKEDNDEA